MPELFHIVNKRAQATVAIWSEHPGLTVGSVTIDNVKQAMSMILETVMAREDQSLNYSHASHSRERAFTFLKEVSLQMAAIIEATLPAGDELEDELALVFSVVPQSQHTILDRCRRLSSLWGEVNVRRAAATPPQPELLRGATTLAEFRAALAGAPGLQQAEQDEWSKWVRIRARLNRLVEELDGWLKRWLKGWRGNFVEGSDEIEALKQVPVEPGGKPPQVIELASVTVEGESAEVVVEKKSGRHATRRELQWEIEGDPAPPPPPDAKDAGFTHRVPIEGLKQRIGPFPPGTVLHLRTRAGNSIGQRDSAPRVVRF